MKRSRSPQEGDDDFSEQPITKYLIVDQTSDDHELMSSDEEDYQTSDEDYEDYYDEPFSEDELLFLEDDEYEEDEYDDGEDYYDSGEGNIHVIGNNNLPFFPLFGVRSNPLSFLEHMETRDFFLLSDGFLDSYKGDLVDLKERILKKRGRVVNNAEAFFRVFLMSNLKKRYCEQREKYGYLLSLGEQKTEKEWSSMCTEKELELFSINPSETFCPSKFEILNATIYLICTEEEARKPTPLFTIINTFTNYSDLPHATITTEIGLEAFFSHPMIPRDLRLMNPIPLTKNYAIMAESAEKKEEIRTFLLKHGAPNVVENMIDPTSTVDYTSLVVVFSDAIPDIIEHNADMLDLEAINIGIISSFNHFCAFSSVVRAVDGLTNIIFSPFFESCRPKLLSNISIKSLVLEYRKRTRKMIPKDEFQEYPIISPSERVCSILPNEVFFVLLQFLPIHDIMNNFSMTCKKARKMCFADHLWKDICLAYSSNHKFLKPYTLEENLSKTKLPHYYIFRNIINPILIDYKYVKDFLISICATAPFKDVDIVNFEEFNNTVTTALYLDRYATEDSQLSVGATKMFGCADLPLWLHNTIYGKTPLLLQLNITEMREKGIGILSLENSPFKHLFPQSGILYFFKDMDSRNSDDGIILHYDGDLSELKRTKGEKLASAVVFYEALCIPKRSELIWSKSTYLNSIITNRDLVDNYGIDDYTSQLIHAKFIREDCTHLFGELSCFTEGEWYDYQDDNDPDDEQPRGRSLNNYVHLGNMLAPIFQLSGKLHMGRRMEATGFSALITDDDMHAKWKLVDRNKPNAYTLDQCYVSDFFKRIPKKFRKAFKSLMKTKSKRTD